MDDILRDLSGFSEYVPGRGVEEVAEEHGLDPGSVVKLSGNENPLGAPPKALRAIEERAEDAGVYPTNLHTEVRRDIADSIGVDTDNLVLGAGADGVFDTVGRAVISDGDAVLTPSPGFSYYGMSARNQGGVERSYELEKETGFQITPEEIIDSYRGEEIVYVTAPNNPTGTTLEPEGVREVAENVDGLVFVDEAYWEFANHESAIHLVGERDDIAVARTFSKAYGLAGLRVGYGVLPSSLAPAYRKVMTPFCVGTLSLHAARAALQDKTHLERTLELAQWGRDYMAMELDPRVYSSEANFVLIDVSPLTAADVAGELEERGVIVRDTSSFGLPGCIRVSVGRKPDTERAVSMINEVCG